MINKSPSEDSQEEKAETPKRSKKLNISSSTGCIPGALFKVKKKEPQKTVQLIDMHDMVEKMVKQQQHIEELNAHIKILEYQLQEKEEIITSQQTSIRSLYEVKNDIDGYKRTIEDQKQIIEGLENQIEELNKQNEEEIIVSEETSLDLPKNYTEIINLENDHIEELDDEEDYNADNTTQQQIEDLKNQLQKKAEIIFSQQDAINKIQKDVDGYRDMVDGQKQIIKELENQLEEKQKSEEIFSQQIHIGEPLEIEFGNQFAQDSQTELESIFFGEPLELGDALRNKPKKSPEIEETVFNQIFTDEIWGEFPTHNLWKQEIKKQDWATQSFTSQNPIGATKEPSESEDEELVLFQDNSKENFSQLGEDKEKYIQVISNQQKRIEKLEKFLKNKEEVMLSQQMQINQLMRITVTQDESNQTDYPIPVEHETLIQFRDIAKEHQDQMLNHMKSIHEKLHNTANLVCNEFNEIAGLFQANVNGINNMTTVNKHFNNYILLEYARLQGILPVDQVPLSGDLADLE